MNFSIVVTIVENLFLLAGALVFNSGLYLHFRVCQAQKITWSKSDGEFSDAIDTQWRLGTWRVRGQPDGTR